jgi:hypothetical protein
MLRCRCISSRAREFKPAGADVGIGHEGMALIEGDWASLMAGQRVRAYHIRDDELVCREWSAASGSCTRLLIQLIPSRPGLDQRLREPEGSGERGGGSLGRSPSKPRLEENRAEKMLRSVGQSSRNGPTRVGRGAVGPWKKQRPDWRHVTTARQRLQASGYSATSAMPTEHFHSSPTTSSSTASKRVCKPTQSRGALGDVLARSRLFLQLRTF